MTASRDFDNINMILSVRLRVLSSRSLLVARPSLYRNLQKTVLVVVEERDWKDSGWREIQFSLS